jgi:hypothetical protein
VSDASNAPASCAALAAQLIVEGCLPIIQGSVKGKAPVEPVVLSKEQRQKLGLNQPDSLTLFYPAGQEGVFFDGGANMFRIWFNGDDCEAATDALHRALMRAFPAAQQLDEVAHQEDPRMRARVYRVELGGGRLATISTSFGSAAPGRRKFIAEVKSLRRAN